MSKLKIISLFVLSMLVFACSNPWDDHVKVNDNVLRVSIGDYLASKPEFSKFVELIGQTGMDAVLSSSAIYTVWAPTNDAMATVNAALLDTDAKKKMFVSNHIAFGSYSSKDNLDDIRLVMRSGKVLDYSAQNALIDNKSIAVNSETDVSNGTVQVISEALAPRLSAWEILQTEAPDCKFVSFLNGLTTSVFDPENSQQIGVDQRGRPVYDTVWKVANAFIDHFVDLSDENLKITMLVPSDEVFDAEFQKYQRYYRVDDRRNFPEPSSKDSVYIKLMIARDMVASGDMSASEAPDTLVSFYQVKVPFVRSAVSNSFKASNGYIHYVSDCYVKITDKVKPIFIEAENSVYSIAMSTGTPNQSRRLRAKASGGMDYVCDNAHTSQMLSGVLFAGPVVSSIKYRVKIRAINDFGKSYRNADTSVVLIQKLGTVSYIRDELTNRITTMSAITNSLNYANAAFGQADVNSDTIFVRKREYSPLEQAMEDEIDLGFYEFNKSDNVFLRLIPLSARMAVTADYFRLVPIIEE